MVTFRAYDQPNEDTRHSAETQEHAREITQVRENPEISADFEVSGRVGEVIGDVVQEDVPQKQQAQGAHARTQTVQERIADLEAHLPSRGSMERSVRKEIQKEIRSLEYQAADLKRKNNYHLLNNIYFKICELSGILDHLVSATFEYLKSLWLRYVHGIVV